MLVYVTLGDVCVEVGALDEAEEEFVDNLKVRPGEFEDGLVLFGIECVARRVHRRRN